MTKPSLSQQISEIGREIGLRRNVYPGMVIRGKLRQGEADEHMRRIEAAYETLKWLEANRAAVVEAARIIAAAPGAGESAP